MKTARGTDRLNDRTINGWLARRRKGEDVPRSLSDGGGLILWASDTGTARWIVRYRFNGKDREHAAGTYPEVTLAAARDARATVKAQLRAHKDPAVERRAARVVAAATTATTFEAIASRWLTKEREHWSEIHDAKSTRALERDIYPVLGALPITTITPGMVGTAITAVLDRGVRETANRILEHVESIFDFAMALDLRADNPARPVRELLPRRPGVRSYPAILDIKLLRDILARCDTLPIPLSHSVRNCNRLLAFTAARPGNVVAAEWSEFDLESDAPKWTVPRAKMKKKEQVRGDFVVFLGPTITAELRAWREITGGKGYCFVSPTGKRAHVAHAALDKLYSRTLGLSGKHCPHGWRSSLRSIAAESREFDRDVLEAALDHKIGNAVEQAYNRAQWHAERQRLAKWWDEQLTGTKVG